MERQHEGSARLAGAYRSFDHEGGDDGEDSARGGKGGQGALMVT